MNIMVVPTNYPGFMTAAKNAGYIGGTGEGTFDGLTFEPQFAAAGNTSNFPTNLTYQAVKRTFSDNWTNAGGQWSNVAALYTDSSKNFIEIGTHGLEGADQMVNFKSWIDNVVTLSNDTTVFCSLREFLEYLHVKNNVVKTESFTGNTLTITLNYSGILNKFLSWYDLSLFVNTTETITGVSVDNNFVSSFNASTKLVNINKRKIIW